MRLAALIVAWVTFTGWSFWTIGDDGLSGLASLLLGQEDWARQVFVDLAIAVTVAWAFMFDDAKARRLPFWPYVVGSIALGQLRRATSQTVIGAPDGSERMATKIGSDSTTGFRCDRCTSRK